jgi:hypothetical protein
MKKVILVHGWKGTPNNHWFPWLKKELETRGFQVTAPKMPSSNKPLIESWVNKLNEVIKTPNENTYLVGHSIGSQAIIRFLERINNKVGGAVFVAGFFNLPPLTKEEELIAKPWLETPINKQRVKENAKDFTAIFSDNDSIVPLTDKELFKEFFGANIVIEHQKGHFTKKAGVTELPIVLKELERMSLRA